MTLAEPVAIDVNPNDPSQYVVLWGNGRVDSHGGAPAITSGPTPSPAMTAMFFTAPLICTDRG